MGFLDHSTNNIIVDAVLTDYGRSKLANQGANAAALVSNYAFADDEVDYSMITKYGVQVGKEKIEKNTPIFEASTNANFGVKYILTSSENPAGRQATFTYSGLTTLIEGSTNTISMTALMTDTDDSVNSPVRYEIEYDPLYISVSGGDGGETKPNQGNSRYRYISPASNQPTQTFVITLNASGREDLIQKGLGTSTETTLNITTSTFAFESLTLQIQYAAAAV